jgi:hypothetical protein
MQMYAVIASRMQTCHRIIEFVVHFPDLRLNRSCNCLARMRPRAVELQNCCQDIHLREHDESYSEVERPCIKREVSSYPVANLMTKPVLDYADDFTAVSRS